ncbi:hypothetical protein HOD38_04515 [archaeon]|nr:hypothetical protein [archaeon]MBT4397505.1 hypothetical protein [archaeon]MBT4440863.1 hypothetical protein [archaeon]
MGDLKKLMAGYVDAGKRREIEDRIRKRGYRYLDEVKRDAILMRLFGLNKRKDSASQLRKKLFEAGFFTELPVDDIVDTIDVNGPAHAYLDPRIVGDKVEEYRKQIIDSEEFKEWVERRFDSFEAITRPLFKLGKILGTGGSMLALRKALFELGYFSEVPVASIVESLSTTAVPIHFNRSVVGDKVYEHMRKVIDSQEFADHINSNYDSLMDLTGVRTSLAKLFGVKARNTEIRRALYEENFLTELPVERLLLEIRVAKNHNTYFDPETVGEEMVELYTERFLRSREFREWLYEEYPSLDDIRTDTALGGYLGVGRNAIDIRKELQERGFYPEFSVADVVDRLGTNDQRRYFDKIFVGEGAGEYRREIIESKQFEKWICDNFDSLMAVRGVKTSLARILGVKPINTEVRRALFEENFLTELPIKEVIKKIKGKKGYHPYFDSEVVGDMVESYKVAVIGSEEFKDWLYDLYPRLGDVRIFRGLGNLFGADRSVKLLRRGLRERGFYPEFSVAEIVDSLGSSGGNPYLDPEVMGDDLGEYRERVLESSEFEAWLYERYPTLSDTNYSKDLATLLGIDGKLGDMRRGLVERGFYTDRKVLREVVGGYGNE